MNDVPKQIDAVFSPEGSEQWTLVRRPDKMYCYFEYVLEEAIYHIDDDGGERDVAAPARWIKSYQSGLFNNENAARSDSFDNIIWLFDAICQD